MSGRAGVPIGLGGGSIDCPSHRASLLALLEDHLGAGLPPATRVHLSVCEPCRAEFGDLVLTGRAVERALADARTAEPRADAWPRLQARIVRRQPHLGRVASPILSIVMGAGLAVAMLLPLGAMPLRSPQGSAVPSVLHEAGLDPAAIQAAGRRDAEEEARSLRAAALVAKESVPAVVTSLARLQLIRMETSHEPDWRAPTPRSAAMSFQ